MKIIGKVVSGPFAAGSKSEREAIYLEADDGQRYVLRRAGANAFDDGTLEPLLGQQVICRGKIIGYTLLADSIEPVPH
ncbi:MAG: hypothetical protein WEE89_07080 [Gemmatimonadota bacterium]